MNKNETEAFRLFKLSADQGSAHGRVLLGHCYYFGKGVNQDVEEAFRLFQLSADQGNTLGRTLLEKYE